MLQAGRILIIASLLLVLNLFGSHTFAAEYRDELRDFAVRNWGKSSGLPDAPVTVITQTRDGYLWVGTGAGLFRFNGIRFTCIPLGEPSEQPRPAVSALCEDDSGALWIGSPTQALWRLKDGDGRRYGPAEGLPDVAITSLSVDSHGQLWVGTKSGAACYDGVKFRIYTTNDGLPGNQIVNVHAAKSGVVWITTTVGVCRFKGNRLEPFHFAASEEGEAVGDYGQVYEDTRGNLWAFRGTYLINVAEGKRINYFPGEKSAKTRVWSLCEGHGGRLWIGASGRGVFCFDGTKFYPVTLNEGRWPNDVRAICEDHEGGLWLGISDIGLVQLRLQSYALLTEHQGLPPGVVTCLAADRVGVLYAAMESGGIYRGNGEIFQPVGGLDTLARQCRIDSLCIGDDDSVWAGTSGAGLLQIKAGRSAVFDTDSGLAGDHVISMANLEHKIWAATSEGSYQCLESNRFVIQSLPENFPKSPVSVLASDLAGGLWLGFGNGRLLWHSADPASFSIPPLPLNLSEKPVVCLCPVPEGGLWIGTDGGGLACLMGNHHYSWDARTGLPDNSISGLLADDEANLWMSSGRGLSLVSSNAIAEATGGSPTLKSLLVFEADSTMLRRPALGGSHAVRGAANRLWFIVGGGLVGVDVRGKESEAPPPQVHVESVLVNNIEIPFHGVDFSRADPQKLAALKLPSVPQTLEFKFCALSFENPGKVRFRHKLTGIDADWVDGGGERQIRYGPLPGGEYDFHVTACNAEGVWNETGANFAFIIPVPMWRQSWVLVLGSVAVLGLVGGGVRFIERRRLRARLRGLEQEQAMERERIRIAQNMHDEIGSKLTKISYLSERARVELRGGGKAEKKLDSIASTSHELLKTLDEIVWAVNPRNDSLEHLAAYLGQYAREYFQETAVECDLRVQSALPHVDMSAEIRHNLFLSFEETLNNVLKHSNATNVSIDIAMQGNELRVTVADNGRGFAASTGEGEGAAAGRDGLVNIRERMEEFGGDCSFESAPGRGATVRLRLPLNGTKIRTR